MWRLVVGALSLALGLVAAPQTLADIEQVAEQLTRDIQAAQRELGAAEAAISRERGQLVERINAAQNAVLELRERAASARRLADEDVLTLRQIETRLDAWQEQSRFQSRLVAGFLDRAGTRSLTAIGEIDLGSDLRILAAYLAAQPARLYPAWQRDRLVLPHGEIADAELLTVGPVTWFRRGEPLEAGLVRTDGDIARASMVFAGASQAGIDALQRTSRGVVTFDPTLSRALLLAEDTETAWEYLRKGGIWVIPILLFAVVASLTALGKAYSVYRLPPLLPGLAERLEAAREDGASALGPLRAQVRGPQAELVDITLAARSREQRDDRLFAALLAQRNRLDRWLGVIAITASVSPLLGLLGTVSGMITTFRLMTLFGAGDASAVSAGISEALITTELGLVVAIPALLAHALLSRKVKSYFSQLENDAVHLSQLPVSPVST